MNVTGSVAGNVSGNVTGIVVKRLLGGKSVNNGYSVEKIACVRSHKVKIKRLENDRKCKEISSDLQSL